MSYIESLQYTASANSSETMRAVGIVDEVSAIAFLQDVQEKSGISIPLGNDVYTISVDQLASTALATVVTLGGVFAVLWMLHQLFAGPHDQGESGQIGDARDRRKRGLWIPRWLDDDYLDD